MAMAILRSQEMNMIGLLLRLWLVVTVIWWGYNLYLNRDMLGTFKDRDWAQALEYGVNNIICDLKIPSYCREISISFWQKSHVNETFGLIVTFVGWPILLFVLCFAIAWVLPSKKRSYQ
jgi:hypothetical protein